MLLTLTTDEQMLKYGINNDPEELEIGFSIQDVKETVKGRRKKPCRKFKGYATTTDKDRDRDIITMEAIEKSKKDLLQPGANTVFFNHDTDQPIGRVVDVTVDSKGMLVEVEVSQAKDVDDIWTKIKDGTLNSLSIRLKYKKVEVEKDDNDRIVAWHVKEMELFEVSVVGIPANPKASIMSVVEKSFAKATGRKIVKGTKVRRKSKGEKKMTKETAKEAVQEVLPDLLKDALSEALPGMLAEAMKGLKTEEKTEEKQEEKKTEEKTDKSDDILAAIKGLTEALTKKDEKEDTEDEESKEEKTKKKSVHTEVDDEEKEKNKKTAKPEQFAIEDEDTVKWCADMWVNRPSQYDSLNEAEKAVAKHVYNMLLSAQISNAKAA